MSRALIRKAIVYCIRDDRLLVFRHLDHPLEETGLQVPKGTVREDESPRAAAARELAEETGRSGFTIQRLLGRDRFDMSPYRDEVQQRYFFEARSDEQLPENWIAGEAHDGRRAVTRFCFFWIPLRQAHVLAGGQSAMVGRLGPS